MDTNDPYADGLSQWAGLCNMLESSPRFVENRAPRVYSHPRGKEALLLYQARVRKAWHNEPKAGHYFDLVDFEERK